MKYLKNPVAPICILIFCLALAYEASANGITVVDNGVIVNHDYDYIVDVDGDNIPLVLNFNVEDDGFDFGDNIPVDLCPMIPNLNNEKGYCDMDLNDDGLVTIVDIQIAASWYDHPAAQYTYGGDGCFYRVRMSEYNHRLATAGLPLLFYGVFIPPHCIGHHTYPSF